MIKQLEIVKTFMEKYNIPDCVKIIMDGSGEFERMSASYAFGQWSITLHAKKYTSAYDR